MTVRRPGPESPRPASGEAASGAEARRRAPVRVRVEKLLPSALAREIQDVIRPAAQITPELIEGIDRRFDLARQYGITHRRLRNYLQRLHQAQRARSGSPGPSEPASSGEFWGERLRAHRRRQASVASILDAAFGSLAECSPDLWDRRAYLMLVGLVYERLATNEKDLPTDELVALAKVLAESRRVAVRAGESPRPEEPKEQTPGRTGPLPAQFADIVRQVYGANFQAPTERPASRPHRAEG